jgi:hypothetical protein
MLVNEANTERVSRNSLQSPPTTMLAVESLAKIDLTNVYKEHSEETKPEDRYFTYRNCVDLVSSPGATFIDRGSRVALDRRAAKLSNKLHINREEAMPGRGVPCGSQRFSRGIPRCIRWVDAAGVVAGKRRLEDNIIENDSSHKPQAKPAG